MNQPPVKLSLRYRIGTWLRTKYGQRETNATNSTLTSSPDENLSTSKGEEPHQNGENATAIAADSIASSLPLREPPVDSFRGEGGTSLGDNDKLSIPARIWRSLNIILFSSYINLLLVFVPAGIALGALHRSQGPSSPISPTVIFAINAVAIIPLAYLLGFATESVARKMGDKVGALLNVTFGNAVELIIFLALVAKEVRIVQASLLGSILANLLLILGMCLVFGGLRFREQLYNSTITQMSACLLSLSVMSLLLPAAFHASFNNSELADKVVLKVSRGTSVVLLLVYLLYLLFQLKSHAYIYESTPQQRIDEESHPGVLADILSHNSVSDSSSSSDGSDTDHSSTSHARAKRIRKAFKRRKRRKSDSIESQRLASDQNVHPTESPSYSSVGHQPSSCAGIDPASNTCSGDRLIKVDFESSSACHPIMSSIAEHPRATPNTPCTNSKKKLKTDNKGDQSVRETEPINAQTNGYHHRRVGFAGPAAAQKNPRRPLGLREASRNRISQLNIPILQSRPSSSRSVRYERPLPGRSGSGNQRIIRRTTSLPDRLPASSGYLSTAPAIRPLPHLMPLAPSSDSSDSDSHQEQKPHLSRLASLILLLVSTGLVAACAEFLVDSIDYFVKNTGTSQAFIGLIILPVVGNAAEHVTAVTMASKNKMDLAIGVALGSSIQIALFVTPITVLLGWCLKTDMSLYFSLLETVSLFASAFITNYLMLDGRTNYLEGALLVAAYVIIAVAAFFFPSCDNLSSMSVPADAKVC